MEKFATNVQFWPPIDSAKKGAAKLTRIQLFDKIALSVTHTDRPVSCPWDGLTIPAGKVLKRTHSAYGTHVYLPDSPQPSVETLLQACCLPGRQWVVQDWVSTLRDLGEYKVYFVQQEIVWMSLARFSKVDGGWCSKSVKNETRSLEEISAMLRQGVMDTDFLFSVPSAYEPIDCMLREFAQDTLCHLVEEDEDDEGYSILSEWCRMDIGIIEKNGVCSYFINEIETNVGLGLFGDGIFDALSDALGELWLEM
ncbi:hypothetical protein QCA50_017808 [Cerrena zonata]